MNRPFKSGLLIAVGLTAVLALSSCSMLSKYLPGKDAQAPQIQGTLNQIDSDQKYLILIADDAYYRFDFSECDSDLSGLEPGDSVTLTYTGTPDQDSEDVTAQLVSITKDT